MEPFLDDRSSVRCQKHPTHSASSRTIFGEDVPLPEKPVATCPNQKEMVVPMFIVVVFKSFTYQVVLGLGSAIQNYF